MSAADTLRQAIAALPEDRRGEWFTHSGFVNASGGIPVCDTSFAPGNSIAAYIRLLGPTVGAALADMLDALDRCGSISSIDPVWDARDALEQALERTTDRSHG